MRILFDQATPLPLRKFLSGHQVATAYQKRWPTLEDGDLIRAVPNLILTSFITCRLLGLIALIALAGCSTPKSLTVKDAQESWPRWVDVGRPTKVKRSAENAVNAYLVRIVNTPFINLYYGAYDLETRVFVPSKVLLQELDSHLTAEYLFNLAARQSEHTWVCFGDSGLNSEDEFANQKRFAIQEIETELQERGANVQIIPPSLDFRWEGPFTVIISRE